MAGVSITIDIDDREVQAQLARLLQFGGARMREFFLDAGPELVRTTRERGERQVSPDGVPWVPLSEDYAAWKAKKRPGMPILKFDFHMLGDMLSYQARESELLWGTNALWGATHQLGDESRGIPERPWLGLSPDDSSTLIDMLNEHAEDALAGR
jgi:phage virion morphogenesis protein